MLARVFSCAVIGLDGVVIEVEVDIADGLPAITIVGLPDAAVQESRERVQSAIKNSGHRFPRKRITVNLAPASVRKAGPAYDLPIAVGILLAAELLDPDKLDGSLIVGELSLDGTVRHVRGPLLVPDEDVVDGILQHRVVRRQDGAARIAEDGIHALADEAFPDDLRAGAFHKTSEGEGHELRELHECRSRI